MVNRPHPTLAETKYHSGNRGWAATELAESPTFYSKFPSIHQRITYRKGGGHVDGKFTNRWSDERLEEG
jgi:hypothetical protein